MAKSKKDGGTYTIHDGEPNPFAMSEEEYEKARAGYYKKSSPKYQKMKRGEK
jgi:hypothetical protein